MARNKSVKNNKSKRNKKFKKIRNRTIKKIKGGMWSTSKKILKTLTGEKIGGWGKEY